MQSEKFDLLEEIAKGFFVLLALHLQSLHVLSQLGHLSLQLLNQLVLRLARLAADQGLHHEHVAVKDATSCAANSDQLALLRKLPPCEYASDPGLDRPNGPSQVLQPFHPRSDDVASEIRLDPDALLAFVLADERARVGLRLDS